ncbi:MAG: DUF819 family protein [Candidatus Omnitrophica bacterium]|jgi:uncharacterized membrane protein|nr:DUF819 family protein [Candidatus Omnitrophota bacterium]
MITNSFAIIVFLLAIETLVLSVSSHPKFKKYFKFIPAVFWIYFLPMLSSSFGLIDSKSPIFQTISFYLLPSALVLLLLSSDIRAILKLEKQALIMMLAGSLGIMIATPFVFYLVKQWVGVQMWSGFGALSASWTGGSSNMIAAKEALGTPDAVFTPMVIVDTIVPYAWMGILVAAVTLQPIYDKWNRSNREIINTLSCHVSGVNCSKEKHFSLQKICLIFIIAVVAGIVSIYIANKLPAIKNVISNYTWAIIIISLLGISFSLTPLKKLENFGSEKIGYFILYFVLTSIGARSNISHINATLILIAAGFLIVILHAIVLLFASRLMKAPMFLVAVASQANIGGVASAPIVAAIYEPGLASVGLLLAILGNIVGTYLGIITGQLCRLFA